MGTVRGVSTLLNIPSPLYYVGESSHYCRDVLEAEGRPVPSQDMSVPVTGHVSRPGPSSRTPDRTPPTCENRRDSEFKGQRMLNSKSLLSTIEEPSSSGDKSLGRQVHTRDLGLTRTFGSQEDNLGCDERGRSTNNDGKPSPRNRDSSFPLSTLLI